MVSKDELLEAIKSVSRTLGRAPSRVEFIRATGLTERQVMNYFEGWNDAVQAAGLEPNYSNVKISDEALLTDWARVVREIRQIPTREKYRKLGRFSPGSFEKHFGPWSSLPSAFRIFAAVNHEFIDVEALLPSNMNDTFRIEADAVLSTQIKAEVSRGYRRLRDRSTYGDPIDFRGLRHKPVNEQGVVFLFGMVASELGYYVEGIQTGFPDCEAKRQSGPGQWQRVRIEFEFESRNFRDHGHSEDGCDVIVCWVHNWNECPEQIEVLELSSIIQSLPRGDS